MEATITGELTSQVDGVWDPSAGLQEAFADFIAEPTLNDRQLRLIEMIVSQLTRSGTMGIDALYDPPFTDLTAGGPEDLFEPSAVDRLGDVIRRFGTPA